MENLEKHDEFEPKPLKEPIDLGFYIKVILFALILGGAYFAFDKWGDQLFGSNKPVDKNSSDQTIAFDTNDGSTFFDSTNAFNTVGADSTLLVNNRKIERVDSIENKSFLKVNTKFDTLLRVKKDVKRVSIVNKYATDEAIFEALKSTDENYEKNQMLLNKFKGNQIFTLESSLKLLSTCGLNILTNKKTETDLTLLSLIKDQKNLSNLYIIDKDGIIYYDAKSNMAFAKITDVTNAIILTSNSLELSDENGQTTLINPIYHPFGKIGFVVLILKNSAN